MLKEFGEIILAILIGAIVLPIVGSVLIYIVNLILDAMDGGK